MRLKVIFGTASDTSAVARLLNGGGEDRSLCNILFIRNVNSRICAFWGTDTPGLYQEVHINDLVRDYKERLLTSTRGGAIADLSWVPATDPVPEPRERSVHLSQSNLFAGVGASIGTGFATTQTVGGVVSTIDIYRSNYGEYWDPNLPPDT